MLPQYQLDHSADFHFGMMAQPIPALKIMTGWDIDCFTAGWELTIKISELTMPGLMAHLMPWVPLKG